MTVREYTVFTAILISADFRNAKWVGSGNAIAKMCHIRKKNAHEILNSLRSKGYIDFQFSDGNNSRYSILVHKYAASLVPVGTSKPYAAGSGGNQQSAPKCQSGTSKPPQRLSIHGDEVSEEVNTKNKREEETVTTFLGELQCQDCKMWFPRMALKKHHCAGVVTRHQSTTTARTA